MKIALLSTVATSLMSSAVASLEVDLVSPFSKDVTVAVNVNISEFSVLAQALEIAELDLILDGEGPFTLFAPPDAAFQDFAAYSPGTIEAWLAEIPPTTLTEVLLYHVFPGEVLDVKAKDLEEGVNLQMANFENATLTGVPLMIEESNVIISDIEASNGRIDIIDAVLIPPNVTVLPGLLFVANATEELSVLVDLAERLNLTSFFFDPAPHTIFAPTDEAFSIFNSDSESDSLEEDQETLSNLIASRIVPGVFDAASLFDGQILTTLSGMNLTVSINNETGVSIDGSTVVLADLFASNGVIHAIDSVILPFEASPPSEAPTTDGKPDETPIASAFSVTFGTSVFLGLLALTI